MLTSILPADCVIAFLANDGEIHVCTPAIVRGWFTNYPAFLQLNSWHPARQTEDGHHIRRNLRAGRGIVANSTLGAGRNTSYSTSFQLVQYPQSNVMA